MKLVFFGTPDFSIPTLNALNNSSHDILRVVTIPDKKSGRGLKYYPSSVKKHAQMLNLPIVEINDLRDSEFLTKLRHIKPDLFIVVAFRKLPESLLKIPLIGAVNLHASLLPKYRGASPVTHAILNGEKKTGITTFLIEQKIDTGDILLQHQLNISNDITTGELLEELSDIGAEIMLNTLDGISNNSIKPKKQDNTLATLAPKINIHDCKINWNLPAESIHNQIRAFTPSPGAFTFYNNKRIKLYGSNIENRVSNIKLKPGQIYYIKPTILIGTSHNYVRIAEIQIEGKKKMPVTNFMHGNPEIVGNYFV